MINSKTLCVAVLAAASIVRSAWADPAELDAARRGQVIDVLSKQLKAYYVFPDVAATIETRLRTKQQAGGYDHVADPETFANMLTSDLRQAGHDKHLRIRAIDPDSSPATGAGTLTAARQAELLKEMAARGFGVTQVQILPGNVGYINVLAFDRIALAAPAITAGMTQVADTDALIIDVRGNGGGDPAGVAFLSSYLFDQRTHLNDLYWREGDRTEQFWTAETVPGKRFGQQKAVYVLTGPRTFSAAEEFTYNLQQLKRATIVGESTGGGAHPGRLRQVTPQFSAFIPGGRAINPVSKTNWEGTGVVPGVSVPAAQALPAAHKLALDTLAAGADPERASQLRALAAQIGQ